MRKILFSALIICASVFGASAQKHVINLNLYGLAVSNLSLGYEYAFHENMSGRLGASYLLGISPPGSINVEGVSADFSASGFALTPEFRFYTSATKEAPRGFYVGPYFRYGSYSTGFTYAHTDPFIGGVDLDAKFKLTEVGFGFQIGVHWLISDRVSLDWQIMGPRYGVYSLSVEISGDNALLDMAGLAEDLETDFADLPGVVPSVTTNGLNATIDVGGLGLPGLRTGLCLGIAF